MPENEQAPKQESRSDKQAQAYWSALLKSAPVDSVIKTLAASIAGPVVSFPKLAGAGEKESEIEGRQIEILRSLSESGIDPRLFDLMLSNELDRALKKQFGFFFFGATIVFTIASYTIIILNSILKWGIGDTAITALIVETPIQFIGLLYIIARNLFPQTGASYRRELVDKAKSSQEGTSESKEHG